MKFTIVIILFLSLSSFFINNKTTQKQNINRKWMITVLDTFSKATLTKAGAYIDLTNKNSAPCFVGCNRINFRVKVSKTNINFMQGIATRMYCEQFMKIEDALSNILPKIKKYQVKGHQLYLKNAAGKILIQAIAEDWD